MSSTFDANRDFASPDANERLRMIEDIVSDQAMPIAERQARLEALAVEWGIAQDEAVAEAATDPVSIQIANALGMLADGGHPAKP